MNLYIERLKKIGFTLREAKVYIVLLNNNSLTATEIAKVANIPRQKIYEILDNIIKKGICVEKIGKIKRYKAVEPEIVFKSIIDQYQENEKIALELSNNLSELYEKNQERNDPLEYIEVLKAREKIRNKWLNLNKNAKKEILIFTKPPYASSPDEAIAVEKKLLNTKMNRRKLILRDICEYKGITSESEKKNFIKMVSNYISNNEEVRIIKELPMKLAIFDERITMLALNDPISLQPSITTMIINHPSFAMSQKKVFENVWKEAMTLEEYIKL